MEVWKAVPGYEELYEVSNLGRIKRMFKSKERLVKGRPDKDGYIGVILSSHQIKKHCKLHRLVAEAFIPNPYNKPQINHKDRNKQNNSADNLEWVTASENMVHCYSTGRKNHKRPVLQFTRDMVFVSSWDSIKEASESLNINKHNISYCCSGELKTAGGYIWLYKEVGI